MAEKWEIYVINNVREGMVSYYSPTTFRTNYGVRAYLQEFYPKVEIPKKGNFDDVIFPYLIRQLLMEGWEPYATGSDVGVNNFCFRLKVSS